MKELDNIKMWEFMAEKFNEDTEFGLVIRDALKNQGFEFKDNKIMPITTSSQKPKFKSGDWIVHQGTENIYQVLAIIDNQYQLRYGDTYTVQKCADVDRCARLWDVAKDAKDGDVLAYKNDIVIFKENNYNPNDKSGCMFVYCSCNNFYEIGGINPTDYKLATQEQRDLLFKKMKEAGYEWDAINKKLVTKTDDAESKDENMIKELLIYLDWLDGRKNYAPRGMYSIKEMLAWVKKQGEKDKEILVLKDKIESLHAAIKAMKEAHKIEIEKQGEQKSFARYKVGDTIYYNSFGRLVRFVIANVVEDGTDNPMYEDKDGDSVFQNDIVHYECAMKRGEQKSAWSEEDEKNLNAALSYIKDEALKAFVKNRTQPKSVWSEEDEEKINEIIDYLDYKGHKTDAEFLKSLRPQSTWKPSDEQLTQLSNASNGLYYNCETLLSLLEQLNKLREE